MLVSLILRFSEREKTQVFDDAVRVYILSIFTLCMSLPIGAVLFPKHGAAVFALSALATTFVFVGSIVLAIRKRGDYDTPEGCDSS